MGVKSNIRDVIRRIERVEKETRYITKNTLNDLAFGAREAMNEEISKKLNIKVKRIAHAWLVKKATNSRPAAEVYIDEWDWRKYPLKHHYFGGDRHRKGMEKALIHWGFMDKSEILTPSPGVTIKPHVYVEMMSQLKLFYKSGFTMNETEQSRKRRRGVRKKGIRFFISSKYYGSRRTRHLKPGVYARVPGVPKPVVMLRIARRPDYSRRMDFRKTAEGYVHQHAQEIFSKAIERAIVSRKK